MEPISLEELPENALLLVDSAAIIYVLEDHPEFCGTQVGIRGTRRWAGTTCSHHPDSRRSTDRTFECWRRSPRGALPGHAEIVVRSRFGCGDCRKCGTTSAACKLKLADAVQAASTLTVGADALVTHDRDFSSLRDLRVLDVATKKSSG